ncbi:outer membrane lipoprotein-sorting protein [Cupriavidus basilensis]|uniref:Outer membrane lipoprotein-sorting protein n=1 Tax=Cupriavidus basilensis TaxID=68895 RepID=A0ABT6AQH1_9BURK|nr:outer membrane lipoprotein-sorting protein [Cupriavidus basilensis]MDF3834835.1 outer membrane lipoprotein-sorting protein [Cupriavidus basilensis]
MHMPTHLFRVLKLLGACAACAVLASGPARAATTVDNGTLAEWIYGAEHILRGKTSAAVMGMKIKKTSFEREYDLLVMTDDRAPAAKVLLRMLGPALWRDNATLKVGEKISFYDPRTNRITVMGNSMLGDNWMGSHFTNDDLMRETDLARHYSYVLVGSAPGKDAGGQAVEDYTIALTPLPTAPVSWGKVIYRLYVGADRQAYPVRVEYFRRANDDKPVRALVYEDVRVMDGKAVPTRLTMNVLDQPGEYTRIEYKRIRFGLDLKSDEFTERAFR